MEPYFQSNLCNPVFMKHYSSRLIILTRLFMGFLLCFCGRLHGADHSSAQSGNRPNVLFIVVDDLRTELGCYGAPQVKSPNIDRLASQSTLFTRAYCQVPVCGASRASLMTSVLPTPSRFRTYLTRADQEVPNCKTLGQVFKEAGYVTLSNGKIFHELEDGADRSWSEPPWRPEAWHGTSHDPSTTNKLSKNGSGRIYEMPEVPDNAYADGQIAERAIADLKRLKEGGKPFFLACGFLKPHLPFYAPKKYWDLYDRSKISIADNRSRPANAPKGLQGSTEYRNYDLGAFTDNADEFHRMMRHGYLACVSYTDAQVGKVLAELDRLGLAENTIVVLWGDHGWNLGEHNFWGKHNTMHHAVNAPLMVRVPGKKSGAKSDALVEFLDVFPTLCELAQVAAPDTVQGRSFVSLLNDPKQSFRDSVYTRYMQGDCVVTEQFIYTKYRNDGEMLYDLKKDPKENRNVAGHPEYAQALAKMKSLLADREAEAKQAKP
jgi:arylsulfatase A-like enzyme